MPVDPTAVPGVRRCAVLGSPIAHSLSPTLHRAAYDWLELDWHYESHEVTEAGLAAFLDELDPSWRGLSLTMPLKQVAVGLMDEVTAIARTVAAVNTVVLEPDGRRRGDNTDVPGMVNALREKGVDRVSTAAVLGGGATARSALGALQQLAATATVYVRTPARAEALLTTAAVLGLPCTVRSWAERREGLHEAVVIVTTPAGATNDLAAAVPRRAGALLDVGYGLGDSVLARSWIEVGGKVVDGLDLLVHQAVLQVGLMTGGTVPVSVLRAAGEKELALVPRPSEEQIVVTD